jgi:hypothetical protein
MSEVKASASMRGRASFRPAFRAAKEWMLARREKKDKIRTLVHIEGTPRSNNSLLNVGESSGFILHRS